MGMLTTVREYCKVNNLVYTFGIKVGNVVYFCVTNTDELVYTLYKMCDGEITVYLENLTLLQTRFQKETLLGMGGDLIEKL